VGSLSLRPGDLLPILKSSERSPELLTGNRAMPGDRLTDLASRTSFFTESLHPTNKPRKNTSHPTGEGQS
jgi:hypothetical protein